MSESGDLIKRIIEPLIDKKLKGATAEKRSTKTPILAARGQGRYQNDRSFTEISRVAASYQIPSDSDPGIYVTVEPPTEVVFLDSLTGGTVTMYLDPPEAPGP